MPISIKSDAISSYLASANDELKMASLVGASDKLKAITVATCADLPTAAANKGRWFYVTAIGAYRYSDGLLYDRPSASTLWAWGYNLAGNLGDNTLVNRSSPVLVCSFGNNWKCVAGGYTGVGLKCDGTLWTWGNAAAGATGSLEGVGAHRSSPNTTAGGGTNWCSVGAGWYLQGALKTDGTLWMWGANNVGQLGNNSTANLSSPVTTSGGGTTWCALAGSGGNGSRTAMMALKTDGTLWTWGNGCAGQVGDNSTLCRSSPNTTAGGGTTWCTIGHGGNQMSAIKTDGTLWMWGYNLNGVLGDNSTLHRSSPNTVAGGGTTWTKVSGGYQQTVALKTDGTIWTWGGGGSGELGDGTTVNKSSPVTVAGGGTNWCMVNAMIYNTQAIKTDGTLWTWGGNSYGQLGTGLGSPRSSPGSTLLPGNWQFIGGAFYSVYGIRST